MRPGRRKEDGTYEITYEDVPTRQVSLSERIEKSSCSYSQTEDKGYKLRDVYDKRLLLIFLHSFPMRI